MQDKDLMIQEAGSDEFVRKAGAVVYKLQEGNIYYLLVSSNKDDNLYILPQGHVEAGESLEETAVRETLEEAGVICSIVEALGYYLNRFKGNSYKTEIFAAEFKEERKAAEERKVRWFSLEEALKLQLLKETTEFLQKCDDRLKERRNIDI